MSNNFFYIKATEDKIEYIESLVQDRVGTVFSKLTQQEKTGFNNGKGTTYDYGYFHKYTHFVEDPKTGERYYQIHNPKYGQIEPDFKQYIIDNFPTLTRYTTEQMREIMPQTKV